MRQDVLIEGRLQALGAVPLQCDITHPSCIQAHMRGRQAHLKQCPALLRALCLQYKRFRNMLVMLRRLVLCRGVGRVSYTAVPDTA